VKKRQILAALLAVSCGPEPPPPDPLFGRLIILNRSQYVLDEVRVHVGGDYSKATNITDSLLIDESYTHNTFGELHVTVFREKYQGGPRVALTTAVPVTVGDGQDVHLTVFDEVFRVKVTRH
jgi:hypothetical protein